jgi:H+/Cl- antiporter ClcA
LNTLNKINITWFMLILIGAVLAFWYIPDVIRFAGNVSAEWLVRLWWIPVMVCMLLFLIVALWFYLQYRLKLKGMQMNMEIEKLKYLQFDGNAKAVPAIENGAHDPARPLIADITVKGE